MAIYRFRKEELEAHLNRNALWAITYGDIMSYLMIFFMIMLSYALAKNAKFKDVDLEDSLFQIQRVFGGKINPELEQKAQARDAELLVSQRLTAKAEQGELGAETKVIVTEKRISLALGEGILFDSGSATLTPGAGPLLEAIAKDMMSVKNEIRVEGHTDNVPPGARLRHRTNWDLSMARAIAVIRQLEAFGVAPQRLSGLGYGEFHPVASNATPEGRAKNRRIDISLLRAE